jgi:RNA polymerase sigma-70 factor, ECF subfamily
LLLCASSRYSENICRLSKRYHVEQSDNELIELLNRGNRQAFVDLYERHKTAIYRYCLRMLSDSDLAEDATQETFIKLYANVGLLQKRESFLPWLFRIARNEVMMQFRKDRRNGLHSDEDVWDEQTPYELSVKAEKTELVQRMLENLKSEYREVLVLREYEQLSYIQIAQITGSTESSIKSRLFKARKALTKRLTEYYK